MLYDPNYSYEHKQEDVDMEGWGDEWDAEMDVGAQDDDDSSWKVRRGAIKVLLAIIHSRPEKLRDLYENLSTELVDRFKERDEKIQALVLHTFGAMLRSSFIHAGAQASLDEDLSLYKQRSSVEALQAKTESFVRAILEITSTKNQNIKVEIMNVIKEMSRSLSVNLVGYLADFLPFIKKAFEVDSSSAL